MKIIKKLYGKIDDAWDNFRARCQRFKKGYAWIDLWDIDIWFINTMKPMLIEFKKNYCGTPMEFQNNCDGWESVLEEMINCLDRMTEEGAVKYLGEEKYNDSENPYKQINKIMDTSKNRFMELFNKYFYNLWW